MPVSECKSKIDKWLYNMANMEQIKGNLPFESEQPIFKKIRNIADIVNLTPEEMQWYNVSLDCYRDSYSIIESSIEKGVEQGIKKGRLKERNEYIESMRSLGYSEEQINEIINKLSKL